MLQFFTLYGIAFWLSFSIMFFTWLVYRTKKNAGIVDISWTIAILLISLSALFVGDAPLVKRLSMTTLVAIWAIRLGRHLYERYLVSPEDQRYARLRQAWGGDSSNVVFLMMFLFQGLLASLVAMPVILVACSGKLEWSSWEVLGIAIWAIGVIGEAYADKELFEFKQKPENKGKVYQSGLWRYSRHPNYFFEFVVWVGIFLFALPSTGGALAVISPLLILGLLLKGSGLPLAEEQSLKSHGEAYLEYQAKTSEFFPWVPK